MSLHIDALAELIIQSRDDSNATRGDWERAITQVFGPRRSSHPRIEARHLDNNLLPSHDPEQNTDAQLIEPVLDAINAAVDDCSVIAAKSFAGTAYLRKEEMTTSPLGQETQSRHQSDHDAYYLQLSVLVSPFAAATVKTAVDRIELLVDHAHRRALEAELAEAEAEANRAQSRVDALKNKLA